MSQGIIDANTSSFVGGDRMPTIDGQTAPWSLEYMAESGLDYLSNPAVGFVFDVVDDLQWVKGMGYVPVVISTVNDVRQYSRGQIIKEQLFLRGVFSVGSLGGGAIGSSYTMGTYTGSTLSLGPVVGLTIGLYGAGIEKGAEIGSKVEHQQRRYFSPNTKGNFWSYFYW